MADSAAAAAHQTPVTLAVEPSFVDHSDADVVLRSADNVDFRVHKAFLSYASPLFKSMFTLPPTDRYAEDNTKDSFLVVPFTENGKVLQALLQFCYPISATSKPFANDLETTFALIQVSAKYCMEGVEKCIREGLIRSQLIKEEPLRVFALAICHGLELEAKAAARNTLRLPISWLSYVPELEQITGGAYHRLQRYHFDCRQIASAVATDLTWIKRESWLWFEPECRDCTSTRPHHLGLLTSMSAIGVPRVTISGDRRLSARTWWSEYIRNARDALSKIPWGSTVVGVDLLDAALGKASMCTSCRARAFPEMREFSKIFAAQVDNATSQVLLEIGV